jgi:hypothetical protein
MATPKRLLMVSCPPNKCQHSMLDMSRAIIASSRDYTRRAILSERAPHRDKTTNSRLKHLRRKQYLVKRPQSGLDTKTYWMSAVIEHWLWNRSVSKLTSSSDPSPLHNSDGVLIEARVSKSASAIQVNCIWRLIKCTSLNQEPFEWWLFHQPTTRTVSLLGHNCFLSNHSQFITHLLTT